MVKEEIRRNVYIGHLKRKTFYDIAYPQSNQIIINYLSYINQNETEFSPRTSHPEVFLEKGVLKICSKYTGEYLCRSVISIKLQSNFIEITLRHGCSHVNLLHIFRTSFTKNTSGWLLVSPYDDMAFYLMEFYRFNMDIIPRFVRSEQFIKG